MTTARELLRTHNISDSVPDFLEDEGGYWFVDVPESVIEDAMIEFARQHVIEALKAAAAQDHDLHYVIINSYPLENIK